MRGFPNYLASKQDYLNCMGDYPEETKRALRYLLADRMIWEATKELSSKSKGKEDETHRVLVNETKNEETGETKEVYTQLELKEDSNARLFQLGFTVDEVKKLIA